uniref:Mitochondrial ribosomal protein S24 n=1 Tax=Bos taurus TaxID=9913 RepID=A0AAA9TSR5_BOVIN
MHLARPAYLRGLLQEPGGPSPSGQGEQTSDLRGSACASLHRPPQGLAVTAHRFSENTEFEVSSVITQIPTGCITYGNLDGEDHAAERTVEDVFLRKFMLGTFPGCLADQLILKRRANQVEICALVLRQLPAHKFYFLVGYSETLLSHFYKCPVRLHLQTVPSKVVYKFI